MTFQEIKKRFLRFFEKKGHRIVSSSSLIPDDPSVLLTTAGMQQFVPYFLGGKSPFGDRVATIQKCFRTSDIEEVGDEFHLTFFEMLGNFSFNNNYFKKEAIEWAYEFLTEEMGISNDRIWFSVFEGDSVVPFDQESCDAIKNLGFSGDKIRKLGRKDNFWGPTGIEGPCGSTVEFYIDDLEVWNLVFNEYFCSKDGKLKPMEKRGVDTGMGLERLAGIMQNVKTIYETDLFSPIVKRIEKEYLSARPVPPIRRDGARRNFRVIADHMRGAIFLISEGIFPSNLERGYILRRLLRRSIRYAKLLDLPRTWYAEIAKTIIKIYKEYYPELGLEENNIITIIQREDEKFGKTLEKGLKELDKAYPMDGFSGIRAGQKVPCVNKVDSKKPFYIFQTYGFPLEMINEELGKRGFFVDEKEFKGELERHQKISRAGLEKKFGGHGLILDTGELKAASPEELKKATRLHTATHLLHQTLREILGSRVKQMGSDITSERLRFDFTHDKKVTPKQIKEIEDLVNEKIKEDLEIKMREVFYKKAINDGALAFFKGKYPEVVKVYSVADFSKEVCGGPHAKRTGELGHFRIKKEESSSAGVRRIRAVLE